jgi:protein-tyrosine phosphatase
MSKEFPFYKPLTNLSEHVTGQADCVYEDWLYLGDLESAEESNLNALGIEYVVSVVNDFTFRYLPTHLPKDHHIRFAVDDSEKQSLVSVFAATTAFLKERCEKKEKVLVHCAAGISRSSAVVLAYLICGCSMTLEDAYGAVKEKRSVICPNIGFMRQLKMLEEAMTMK